MSTPETSIEKSQQPPDGLPVAGPPASTTHGASVEVSSPHAASGGTNTDASASLHTPERSTPGRLGYRQRERVRAGLSERDWQVIRLVAEHRYLTTRQIQRFVFDQLGSEASAARTTRRVMARLSDEGVLRPLERRIGGLRAGSAATVWQISPSGARLLWDEHGHRTHEPSPRFLAHCLTTAEAHLGLLALRGVGAIEAVSVTVEPLSWRRYSGPGGEARYLKPDLTSVVTTSQYQDRWFAEIDCGTESIPTLLRKCEQYQAYHASGIEQETHGAFPLVVWVMEGRRGAERSDYLTRALGRSNRFTPDLYRMTTLAGLPQLIADAAHEAGELA